MNRPLIIRRRCPACATDFVTIYYRRLTPLYSINLYSYMSSWSSANNTLGIDFNLYSDFDSALRGTGLNAWMYCNYDDQVGAFRDCGPTGLVAGQWSNTVNYTYGQSSTAYDLLSPVRSHDFSLFVSAYISCCGLDQA